MLGRYSLLLASFFCFGLAAAAGAQGLNLIYPADKTMVRNSDFLIIQGGNAPPLEEMSITINGVASDPLDLSTPEYKAAFADFLILEPSWALGKNVVVINGLVGGKVVATVKAEILYDSRVDPIALTPPGFAPYVMHTPEKEALCAPCHAMVKSEAELKSAMTESNPCASCHKRMFSKKYVHGPEGIFQCIDCHDSKSKPQRWQVTKDDLALCGECHTEKVEELKKDTFIHGPVAAGGCVVCHDPHAADQPAQLHAPINALCLGCHSGVNNKLHVTRGVSGSSHPLAKVKDPLNPGRELSCVSCHNPHGGMTKAFFRNGARSPIALCQLCHQK